MSISYWQDQSQLEELQYDVTILGGGITGHSLAYWVHKIDPSLKVAVIDKSFLGAGASGRNAGFVTCGSVEHFKRTIDHYGKEEALALWDFSEENHNLLQEHIIQEDATLLGYEKNGSFSLATTENELKELQDSARVMRDCGIKVKDVDHSYIMKNLTAEGFVGGIHYIDDGSVNPYLLLEKIRKVLKQKNSQTIWHEGEEVHSMNMDGDQVILKSQKKTYRSHVCLIATNGYSRMIHPKLGEWVEPTRGQILLTEKLPLSMSGPCYANFYLDYFRQLPTGEFLVGGFRQLQKEQEKGFSDETSEVIQTALEDFINKHLPFAKGKKITHKWSGVMGFSQDGKPIMGSLPEMPQVSFCIGMTAHGIGLAFHCAKALVESVLLEKALPSYFSAKRLG